MAAVTMADLPPPDPDTVRKILALIGPRDDDADVSSTSPHRAAS